MGISFSADEILEMAQEIERSGAKFYREAAVNASNSDTKKMLLDMAAMEDGHLETFTEIRANLTEEEKAGTAFDPDNEAALYLQAMANAHGSEGMKSSTEKFTGKEPIGDILRSALGAEKDSVVFYTGLRGFLTSDIAKRKLEGVITEELSHITSISQKLAEVV